MNQEKIDHRVARDFGEIFNVSFKFLRQNFKPFFQCLLFIAGPFILLSALAGAYYQSDAVGSIGMSYADRLTNPFSQFGWAYLLFILAASAANLATIGTVYAYIITYMEKGPGNFTVNDVARKLSQNIGNILALFFTFTFLIIITVGLIVVIFIAVGSLSGILAVFLGLVVFVGFMIVLPPFFWQLSSMYLVKMNGESDTALNSMNRTAFVMKDNFWWTWLLMVCTFLMVGIASFVFTLPQVIYQMALMFSNIRHGGTGEVSIPFLIVATVCTFFSTLLYSVMYVICAFHYYSLAEKREGKGMLERINEIGKTPENNVEQHY